MFAVEVDLLARRYTATAFDDRDAPEWPPHPARLYSAMVATWADADEPDESERAALRWFEALDPPSITCAGAIGSAKRNVVTHYVPVNDARCVRRDLSATYGRLREAEDALSAAAGAKGRAKAEAGVAKALVKAKDDSAAAGTPEASPTAQVVLDGVTVLPDARRKQARTFPTVRIREGASALVRYEWPQAEPQAELAATLDTLLARVARLGHSSTLVSCRVGELKPSAAASAIIWALATAPVRPIATCDSRRPARWIT